MKRTTILKILFIYLALVSASNHCSKGDKNNTNNISKYKREPVIEGVTEKPYYFYILQNPTTENNCPEGVLTFVSICIPGIFTFRGEEKEGGRIYVDVTSLVNEQCNGKNILLGWFSSEKTFTVSTCEIGLCGMEGCPGVNIEGTFYSDGTVEGTLGSCRKLDECKIRVPIAGILNDLVRYELPEQDNECQTDSDCIISGCSSEVCSAQSVTTTCEAIPPPPGDKCLCLANRCKWYK